MAHRLAKGAFWSLAGAVISRGLALLSSIVVARLLGKIGFGELGIIQSTVGMFGTFAGFGLGMTATKYVAELRTSDAQRAGRIIAISSAVSWVTGVLIGVVLFTFAEWLAANTLKAPHLTPMLRISSFLLFLGAVNGAQTGALSGFEAFKTIARINLFTGLSSFPIILAGTRIWGLQGAIWSLVINQAIGCLLNLHALRAEAAKASIPLAWAGSSRECHVLWQFSLPAVAAGIVTGPVYWLCSVMLVNRPDGYSQMGLFNAANQWFGALLFLPGVLGQALLPVLSETIGQQDLVRARKVLVFYIKLNAALMAPLVVLGTLFSVPIMSSYGPEFREAWPTLILVLFTAGLLAVQAPVGQIIAASGSMWVGLLMNAFWGLTCIAFSLLTVNGGAPGLAGARLGAYAFHALWTFGFAHYYLRGRDGHH